MSSLRIFILEDRPSDAELMERTLRSAGFAFVSKRTDTQQGFVEGLESFEPDIVLADQNLPSFSGDEALRIARETHPDIPVVIVTGSLGDEAAVELVKRGAQDYVLKENLARLPLAVRRAVEERAETRERQQTEEKLRLANTVVENSSTVLVLRGVGDGGWPPRYVSENVRQFGYEPDELLSGAVDYNTLIHPDDLARVTREIAKNTEEHVDRFPLAYRIVTKNGETRWIEDRCAVERGPGGMPTGYQNIILDITERVEAEAAVRGVLMEMIEAVTLTVEKRDPYTAGHQKRVSALAVAIARDMGLDDATVEGIRIGGMIHDIGKVRVPADILAGGGPLTPAEMEIIRTHPRVGSEIVQGVHSPWPIKEMILQHHERLDGSGYPDGRKDESILLEARILAVADVVEAMASHRPYRPALGVDAALDEVATGRGSLYDPAAVDSCVKLFREKGYQFETIESPSDTRIQGTGPRE